MSSFQAASALGQATGFHENERAKRGDGRLEGRGRLRSDIAAVIEKDRRSAFVFERVTRGFSPHLASVCVLLVGLDIDRCRIHIRLHGQSIRRLFRYEHASAHACAVL